MFTVGRIPPYLTSHPSGQAHSNWRGKVYYHGAANTPESHRRYREFLKRIEGGGEDHNPDTATIIDLVERFEVFLAEHYPGEGGKRSEEHREFRRCLVPVVEGWGSHLAASFGPKELKKVQAAFVASGVARSMCNKRMLKVKRFFKWAVSEDLYPSERLAALMTVEGLREGKTAAPETEPVRPVEGEHVLKTLAYVSPQVAAMIVVQWLCGMRPGEVVAMKPGLIDRSRDVWIYRPESHKTKWRDENKPATVGAIRDTRIVAIPVAAQPILAPFLERGADAFCFSPQEANDWRMRHRNPASKAERTTKRFPSEVKRLAKKRDDRRRRKPRLGDRYVTTSYCRAIANAVKRANRSGASIPHWSPNQLRHASSTEIGQRLGQQSSQRWLGHATLDTTSIYSEIQEEELIEIARRMNEFWTPIVPRLPTPDTPTAR